MQSVSSVPCSACLSPHVAFLERSPGMLEAVSCHFGVCICSLGPTGTNQYNWAQEKAQQSRAHPALTEDPLQLATTAHNPNPREFNTVFWLPWCHTHMYTHSFNAVSPFSHQSIAKTMPKESMICQRTPKCLFFKCMATIECVLYAGLSSHGELLLCVHCHVCPCDPNV